MNDLSFATDFLERELTRMDMTGVYVGPNVDEDAYARELVDSIRRHLCVPFHISATVMAPGFPDMKDGSVISGICVAKRPGYWLVCRPGDKDFYCFWGVEEKDAGAHGVYGSPLYCWSA